MGEWECTICGFIHDGEAQPRACPECGAVDGAFKFFAYVDADEWDAEDVLDDIELDEDFKQRLDTNGDMAG